MKEFDEEQRARFARWLVRLRNTRFEGNRKKAYTAAGVNAATWARAEQGLSIKERSLVTILRALAPEVSGDWRALNLDENGMSHVDMLHADDVLDADRRTLTASPEDLAEAVRTLAGRVVELEERLAETRAVDVGPDLVLRDRNGDPAFAVDLRTQTEGSEGRSFRQSRAFAKLLSRVSGRTVHPLVISDDLTVEEFVDQLVAAARAVGMRVTLSPDPGKDVSDRAFREWSQRPGLELDDLSDGDEEDAADPYADDPEPGGREEFDPDAGPDPWVDDEAAKRTADALQRRGHALAGPRVHRPTDREPPSFVEPRGQVEPEHEPHADALGIEEEQLATAARRRQGRSEGQRRRDQQDTAGEGNQDDDGGDGPA